MACPTQRNFCACHDIYFRGNLDVPPVLHTRLRPLGRSLPGHPVGPSLGSQQKLTEREIRLVILEPDVP